MRAIGTNDAVNTCDCCGKSGLKYTVEMMTEAGEVLHYGRVCASRNSGKTQKAIASEIRAQHAANVEAARKVWLAHPARAAEIARFALRPRELIGKAAADFVRDEMAAADAARREIANRFGVYTHEFSI